MEMQRTRTDINVSEKKKNSFDCMINILELVDWMSEDRQGVRSDKFCKM